MGTWAQNNGDAPVAGKPKKDKGEEHSVLHIKDEFDYQGRSYMHAFSLTQQLSPLPSNRWRRHHVSAEFVSSPPQNSSPVSPHLACIDLFWTCMYVWGRAKGPVQWLWAGAQRDTTLNTARAMIAAGARHQGVTDQS